VREFLGVLQEESIEKRTGVERGRVAVVDPRERSEKCADVGIECGEIRAELVARGADRRIAELLSQLMHRNL
jgi:hypothetical protein